MDILRPIATVAEAVASPAYTDVFGRPRWPFRCRFDWFIGVGGDLLRDDGAAVPWHDLASPAADRNARSRAKPLSQARAQR